MFGIGMQELMIILVVALIFIGPTKLPEVARTIAKGLREVRKASDDLRSTIMLDDIDAPPPRTPPLARTLPATKSAAPPIDVEVSPPIHGSVAVAAEGAVSRGGDVRGTLDVDTKGEAKVDDQDDHSGMPRIDDDDAVRALIADARQKLEQNGALARAATDDPSSEQGASDASPSSERSGS